MNQHLGQSRLGICRGLGGGGQSDLHAAHRTIQTAIAMSATGQRTPRRSDDRNAYGIYAEFHKSQFRRIQLITIIIDVLKRD